MALLITPNALNIVVRICIEKELSERSSALGLGASVKSITGLISSYCFANEASQTNAKIVKIFTPSLPLCSANLSRLFSRVYETTFSPSITSLDQADTFLLGECHSPRSSWRQLNGRFISHLSNFFPLIVFVESVPAMEIPDYSPEMLRELFQINSPHQDIYFRGWDYLNYTQPIIFNLMNEKIRLRKEINDFSLEINASNKKIEALIPGYCNMTQEAMAASIRSLSPDKANVVASEMKKVSCLVKKQRVSCVRWQAAFNTIDRLTEEAFPARTQAMVSTLQNLRQGETVPDFKYVFIAGAFHLKEREPLTIGYSLAPLFDELRRQPAAAVMIPSIPDPIQVVN